MTGSKYRKIIRRAGNCVNCGAALSRGWCTNSACPCCPFWKGND